MIFKNLNLRLSKYLVFNNPDQLFKSDDERRFIPAKIYCQIMTNYPKLSVPNLPRGGLF